MTISQEDYLVALYRLSEIKSPVNNKQLAQNLGVSPPSVSEMLSSLCKNGYIICEPYKGSALTSMGYEEAEKILYSHRLWEVFLTESLSMSWSEAHNLAHQLEHVSSPLLLEHLDSFLNYPQYCPHGELIPRHSGERSSEYRSLSSLKVGEKTYIRKVKEEQELMDYLQMLGITINMPITIADITPYEERITIRSESNEIVISNKAAKNIFVD